MSSVMQNEQWIDLLSEEKCCLDTLHEAMAEHHEALRAQDHVAINRALQNNMSRIEQARDVHDRRVAFEKSLNEHGSVEDGSAMTEGCVEPIMRRIGALMDGIERLSQSIRLLNGRNRQLAEYGLDLLRGDYRLLADLTGSAAGHTGEEVTQGQLLSQRA